MTPNYLSIIRIGSYDYEPSFVWMHDSLGETWAYFLFDVPLRSKVTKPFGCPHDDVISLCTKLGYDKLKSCWEMGLLPVWRLRRPVWLAVTAKWFWIWTFVQLGGETEDPIWQVSWRLDRICGLWICTIDFDDIQHGGRILMFPWEIICNLYGRFECITRHWK